METIVVEIKPVNIGKEEFQSREEAVVVAHFTIFRLSETFNEGLENIVSERDSLPQVYLCRWRT